MRIKPLKLQDFLTQYEHSAKHLLSCADCDGFSMNTVLAMADAECYAFWNNLHLSYTHAEGHPLLRREIARQYDGIDDEKVIVTSSTEEALCIALKAMIEPGDHVISVSGFEPHYHIPEALGAHVDLWQPEYRDGIWAFDVTQLEESIRDNTKLIILSFPHNPTGSLLTHDDLQRITDLAKQRGITLLSDEVFRGVERNPKDTLKSAVEISKNAIVCSGLSKVYGVAGLRIGWVIVHDADLRKRLLTHHYYSNVCAAAPSEILALIVLRNAQNILHENLQKIEGNLVALSDFFKKHTEIFRWSAPPGGTVGLAEVRGRDVEELCQNAVANAGIMIAPSFILDHGNHHIRIGYGRKNLPQTLDAFSAYLTSNP